MAEEDLSRRFKDAEATVEKLREGADSVRETIANTGYCGFHVQVE